MFNADEHRFDAPKAYWDEDEIVGVELGEGLVADIRFDG